MGRMSVQSKRKRSESDSDKNKRQRRLPKKSASAPVNESDYFHRVKKEAQLGEPKTTFGAVDNLPDVQEVHEPTSDDNQNHDSIGSHNGGAGSNSNGGGGTNYMLHVGTIEDSDEDNGEVQLVSSNMEKQLFPHQREHCQTHKFHPQNLYKGNQLYCVKCYCFICDKPASECDRSGLWFKPDQMNTLTAHHCNAYPSKNSQHWQIKKWLALNPVQNLLVHLTNKTDSEGNEQHQATEDELYAEYRRVKLRMDRSWRLYEAGEAKQKKVGTQVKSILTHKFQHVTAWFQKLFFATRIVKQEQKWISKFVILDAMTEVMVARTWRPPKHASAESEWDQDAEKTCSRIMLSLGSRWLTCYAKCHKENRVDLSKAIQKRILHFKNLAKEKQLFNSGFAVILSLSRHGQNTAESATEVLKACSNLYRSILRRRLHHVKLPTTDKNAGPKYHEVCMKDTIMLPFLSDVKDHNFKYCDEISIKKRCEGLSKKCQFYHDPCVDNWKKMFEKNTNSQILTLDDVSDSFDYLQRSLDAKYTFSTRRKVKFDKIVKFTLCYFHIALSLAAEYPQVSKDGFTLTNKAIAILLNIIKEYKGKITPIEPLIIFLCLELTKSLVECSTQHNSLVGTPKHMKSKLYMVWPKLMQLFKVAWNIESDKYKEDKSTILQTFIGISSPKQKMKTYYVFQELGMITTLLLDTKRETGRVFWGCHYVQTVESYKRLTKYAKIVGKSMDTIHLALPEDFNQNTLKKETDLLLSIKESEELSSTSLNIDDNSIVSTVEMDHSEHRKLRQVKSIFKMRKGDGNFNDNENGTAGDIKAEKYTQSNITQGSGKDICKNEDDYAKWTKYGSNHQLSTSKKHVERIEKGNLDLAVWYQYTFKQKPLGIQICCKSGQPVIQGLSDEVKKMRKDLNVGDVIQSINDKYVQDLWRFLPLDIRQEDFLICDPNNTDKLVPCKFIVNSMMKEFEKFLGKAAFPINIAFVKEVRSKEPSEQTKNLVHDRIDSTKDQKA